MEYRHPVRYLRVAPKKMALMSKEIIGKTPEQACEWLSVQNQKSARYLASAIAAAINNAAQERIDLNKTVVIGVSNQKGPVFMRRWIVSKGRALPKRKPTTHSFILFGHKKVKPAKKA